MPKRMGRTSEKGKRKGEHSTLFLTAGGGGSKANAQSEIF